MSSKSKGTKYELFVEKICKSINSYSCFKLIELKQNKKIIGKSGVEHQIDVYWEFEFNNCRYKFLIECKDYNNKISKDKVATLHSISLDISDSTPIITSTKGFQSGAKAYAKAVDVTPFICREVEEPDLEGRVCSFEIHLIILGKPKVNIKIKKDDEWVQKHNYKNFNLTHLRFGTIIDYETNQRIIVEEFIKKELEKKQEDRKEKYNYSNAFFEYKDDDVYFKFTSLLIEIEYDKQEEIININGDDYIGAFLVDVLSKQNAIVYKDGQIKILND